TPAPAGQKSVDPFARDAAYSVMRGAVTISRSRKLQRRGAPRRDRPRNADDRERCQPTTPSCSWSMSTTHCSTTTTSKTTSGITSRASSVPTAATAPRRAVPTLGYRDYLGALQRVLARFRRWGPTIILSDGDVVFQPRKVERSGIAEAVDGHVLIYIHKEE